MFIFFQGTKLCKVFNGAQSWSEWPDLLGWPDSFDCSVFSLICNLCVGIHVGMVDFSRPDQCVNVSMQLQVVIIMEKLCKSFSIAGFDQETAGHR